MTKEEMLRYLRESEISLEATDSVRVVPLEYGTKVLYYHENEIKPYKTRVYLTRIDETELLR
jgi:hypothetical protein